MTNQEAIKYLQQLYPNGGHCWLDEQRIEAIGMAIDALQEEPVNEDLEAFIKERVKNIPIVLRSGFHELCRQLIQDGAEWGKNQAMAEIQAQSMALAHGCPKEPVSEDLKNAADNALESISDQYDIISVGSCLEMFRLGTEWQKKHQAEKDLELTWEDMMLIHKCIKDAMNYHLYKMIEGMEGQKVVYQEVLKRFKKQKGE